MTPIPIAGRLVFWREEWTYNGSIWAAYSWFRPKLPTGTTPADGLSAELADARAMRKAPPYEYRYLWIWATDGGPPRWFLAWRGGNWN